MQVDAPAQVETVIVGWKGRIVSSVQDTLESPRTELNLTDGVWPGRTKAKERIQYSPTLSASVVSWNLCCFSHVVDISPNH